MNIEKCKILQGRKKVVLIPDLNAYENWSNKAKQFQKQLPGTTFKVSDLIENFAPNQSKKEGEDIADFLTRMDWKEFRKPVSQQIDRSEEILKLEDIQYNPGILETGKEFDFLKVAWIQTKQGKNYDLIFTNTEDFLPYGENLQTVNRLGQFYNKDFKPLHFEGETVYCIFNN